MSSQDCSLLSSSASADHPRQYTCMNDRNHSELLELSTGSLITYKGPRKLFLKPKIAPALFLGREEGTRIFFVSLLSEDERWPGELRPRIGFLPVTEHAFIQSFLQTVTATPPNSAHFRALQTWRQRRSEGTASAFGVPLWQAESATWQAVTISEPNLRHEDIFVEWAFPVPSETGRLDTIEVNLRRLES